MQGQEFSSDIAALIYDAEGRRTPARIAVCELPEAPSNTGMVFCESAIAGELAAIYGNMATEPRAAAQLHSAPDTWRSSGAAPSALKVRPLGDMERAIVRGIYSLACQAQPCFAREGRAIWEALMGAWRAAGLHIYLFERDGRPRAYALLGEPLGNAPQPCCQSLYEFAALPDSGVALNNALAAAHSMNICTAEVSIRGSALTIA